MELRGRIKVSGNSLGGLRSKVGGIAEPRFSLIAIAIWENVKGPRTTCGSNILEGELAALRIAEESVWVRR